MNINKRIQELQELVERSKPCQMTVRLKSGEEIITDPCGAIKAFHDLGLMGEIVEVTAARDDYSGLAGVLTALCR